jgi:ABC-type Fe3+-siderophore transport system, permease component
MTKRLKLTTWLISLTILMLILAVINLNTGEMRISPQAIWNLIINKGTYTQAIVIFDFRMPRIVVTLLVGFALAIAGNVIQSTTQNPMADTSFLGINSGAGIFVMLFIALVKTKMQISSCCQRWP